MTKKKPGAIKGRPRKYPKTETVKEVETITTSGPDVSPAELLTESDKAKETLFIKLTETAEAAGSSDAPVIEKGDTLEQTLEAIQNPESVEPLPGTETPAPGQPQPRVRKNKPGAGRPKKDTVKEETKEKIVKVTDPIPAVINGAVMPIISKKFHKEYKDLVLSKDQLKELETVTPPAEWMKPSWGNYFLLLFGFYSTNFFMANKDQETREREAMEKRLQEQISRQEQTLSELQSRKNPNDLNKENN